MIMIEEVKPGAREECKVVACLRTRAGPMVVKRDRQSHLGGRVALRRPSQAVTCR